MCGIISSLYYTGLLFIIPMFYPGYNSAAVTVSELSAIGAPTRQLWVWLCAPYPLTVAAFGWGVWHTATGKRALRICGILLFSYGVFNIYWPPMHRREVLAAGGGTFTDTMHLAYAGVTVSLMMLSIGFGAAARAGRFRTYSIVTMATLLSFGVLTGIDAPKVQANLPTPLTGLWERINIGVFLLWVIVLAIMLLHYEKRQDTGRRI
jgi:hypothetical protein